MLRRARLDRESKFAPDRLGNLPEGHADFSDCMVNRGRINLFQRNTIERSGIQSMPVGQYEAAEILGYGKAQTFFKIILPQVIKRILPSVTNEVITLVKDTSLAFTLSVAEMFSIAKALAASQTNMMPFVAAAVFYYIFNLVVAVAMEWIEKKLDYYR